MGIHPFLESYFLYLNPNCTVFYEYVMYVRKVTLYVEYLQCTWLVKTLYVKQVNVLELCKLYTPIE